MTDLNRAIAYAQMVNAAYAVDPANLADSAGVSVDAGGDAYTVVTSIYASDLATDMNPERGDRLVSIGLILQSAGTGEVVVAVRGTEGILEWIHDAEFNWVTCPFLMGAGHTEDGFTDMYMSLRTGVEPDSPTVVQAIETLAFPRPMTSLTMCGHSMGGAIVTLLALDLVGNTILKTPAVYTYASPKAGDPLFVSTYNQAVPNTTRVANRVDIVPKLPLPPFYDHVAGLYDLNPIQLLPFPPRFLVRPEIACEHALDSYLHLLSRAAGGPVIPLDPGCTP